MASPASDTAEKGGEHERQQTPKISNRKGLGILPTHIDAAGESGRKGFNPLRFLKICGRSSSKPSMLVNVLWPFVPVAIALHFATPEAHVWIFALNYIAMVPAANLLGFAGQELARKLPKVFGVILETTLSSVVEIVLFMVLIHNDENGELIPVIQAAILGSILCNLLLCLGLCFFVGGIRREEQDFHEAVSETGSGLLLVAGFGLLIPSAFYAALSGSTSTTTSFTLEVLTDSTLQISRATAIILLAAFLIFIWFQMRSHHGLYDSILEFDEHRDADKHEDMSKAKLTLTECVIAIVLALTCVCMSAVFLVFEIEYMVNEQGVPDNFLGLILVPLVEKAAEHLTAIDEAW